MTVFIDDMDDRHIGLNHIYYVLCNDVDDSCEDIRVT